MEKLICEGSYLGGANVGRAVKNARNNLSPKKAKKFISWINNSYGRKFKV
jgi:hypothetical protein